MFSVGHIIRCSMYETRPYRLIDVDGPCTCPEYIRHIDGDDTPSEHHYHATCVGVGWGRGEYYLAGYRLDGTNVWTDDRLTLVTEDPPWK